MFATFAKLGLNAMSVIRKTNLEAARETAASFNDVRLVVMGDNGEHWVVKAGVAAKLRAAGYETI